MDHGHRAPRGQGERNVWWLHQSLTHRRLPLSSQRQTSGPSARLKKWPPGNSLVVLEWLGLCTFTAEGVDSILSWGTKILQAALAGHLRNKNRKTDMTCSHLSFHGQSQGQLQSRSIAVVKEEAPWRLWPWSEMWSAWVSTNRAGHLTPTENPVPRRRSGPQDTGWCLLTYRSGLCEKWTLQGGQKACLSKGHSSRWPASTHFLHL